MRRRIGVAIVIAALAAVLVGPAAGAYGAEAPAWQISQKVEPTNLVPGSPREAVQELTVHAEGGTFTLSGNEPEKTTTPLPYNATASEVQAALDEHIDLGNTSTYTVTGAGPGESSPYKITIGGGTESVALHGGSAPARPMPDLHANGEALTGTAPSVSVKTVTAGAFEGTIAITATNVGGASTDGSTVTLSAQLPSGITAQIVEGGDDYSFYGLPRGTAELKCEAAPAVSCTFAKAVMPGDQLTMYVGVRVAENAGEHLTYDATISGGGAQASSAREPLTVSNTPAAFGVQPGSTFVALSSGQAGAHPNVTAAFSLNATQPGVLPAQPKDIRFDMPPGLVGQAVGMPQCTMAAVQNEAHDGRGCPANAMVGMASVSIVVKSTEGWLYRHERHVIVTPVWNIKPAPGEPAAFAFQALTYPVRLDTSVLSNGKSAVRVTTPDLTEAAKIMATTITLWGVPAEMNGEGPGRPIGVIEFKGWTFGGSGVVSGEPALPLLTSPQSCSSPLDALMETDSWSNPGAFVDSEPLTAGTLTGCENLRFEPSFRMLPDTLEAGAPAGYTFNLKVPQHDEVGVLATPNVKNVALKLPLGTVINPSAAWGLTSCSNAQFYGPSHGAEEPAQPANCPRESQVGTVAIKSPDLEETLEGQVYLAQPECGPCTASDAEDGKMVRLFLNVVGNGEGGVVIKLAGRGRINTTDGQIETIFEEDPQLPFSELKLKLAGGPRAVLANPRTCGPTSSSLGISSWDGALGETHLGYGFNITQNCFGAQFSPSFSAGMPNNSAGAKGEFTLAFGRADNDQFLKQITLHMPPGLLGTLTGVELCRQAQANAGTCGAGSLIGEAQVLTGPGADPFLVEGGRVYLTEGYGGSQFGLSIVVPAVAGPYTLGGMNGEGREADNGEVVVRSQLFIDPHTAQLTAVSSDMPAMLDGIPLQLRAVNVKLNRPGFMFNPTSCEKMAITGTIASWEGLSANVSSPFQLADCGVLPFAPRFEAFTKAFHSRKGGALLHVVVRSASGQADLREVRVELPRAMPSELATLKQACTEGQFASDPAGCPAGSMVGHASVLTPVLPVALEGPAYFVSHGGKKYPELVLVLKGYGVSIELDGETEIKDGTTISTFRSVPDVPFNRFDLVLPMKQGDSALGLTSNPCKHPLLMPTRMVAQSGKVIEGDTRIQVAGCKPAIYVLKHMVHGASATVAVRVPYAGRLIGTGAGIAKVVERRGKAGVVAISVHLTRAVRKRLAEHRRGMRVKVQLAFHAKHQKTLHASVVVKLR